MRPVETPEEQIFLSGLEQRNTPLFAEIVSVIGLTKQRLGNATSIEEVRFALAEGSSSVRALSPKYERRDKLALSAVHKADSIITSMAREAIGKIRKTYD